jgi:uncharacterized membrane protein YsdA (DUF1294 family)
MSTENILTGIFVFINVVAFLVMANDKHLSRKGGDTERIPEGLIFFMATLAGAVGVYLGMIIFRHKTRKWYFQVGIPLLILQNLATLYLIREILV